MKTRTTIGVVCTLAALVARSVGAQVCQGDQTFDQSPARIGGIYEADEEFSSYGGGATLGTRFGTYGSMAAAGVAHKTSYWRSSPSLRIAMGQGVRVPSARRAQLCPRLEFQYSDKKRDDDTQRLLIMKRTYRIGLDGGFAIKAMDGVDVIPFVAVRKSRDRVYIRDVNFSPTSPPVVATWSNTHSDDATWGVGVVLLNALTVKTYATQAVWAGPYNGSKTVGVQLLAHIGRGSSGTAAASAR